MIISRLSFNERYTSWIGISYSAPKTRLYLKRTKSTIRELPSCKSAHHHHYLYFHHLIIRLQTKCGLKRSSLIPKENRLVLICLNRKEWTKFQKELVRTGIESRGDWNISSGDKCKSDWSSLISYKKTCLEITWTSLHKYY